MFFKHTLLKWRDQQKDVLAGFIDYEKAFDKVKYSTLYLILYK